MIGYSHDKEDDKVVIKLELRRKIFFVDRNVLLKAGTYFYGLLSSGAWQPNSDGVYVIDRYNEGFERILDCLSTGKLNCDGLTAYEIECVYGNLDYFLVPFVRLWDYSKVAHMDNIKLSLHTQLKDGRLCGSTADDYEICIFNMDSITIETTMEGHSGYIRAIIQLEDGRICSCSYDETIKLWNIESGHCDITIVGHIGYACCVIQLIDSRLCIGSYGEISEWSKDSGVCELIDISSEYVLCLVQLRNGTICSGGSYGKVKLWNLATGVCEMTLIGHTAHIMSIVIIDEIRICTCSYDKKIKVWNIRTGVCERTLEGHTGCVKDMVLLLDGRICSVSYDGSGKIWNVETGVCDLTVQVCTRNFYKVVQLQDGRLVVSNSGSEVYVLGLYNLRS